MNERIRELAEQAWDDIATNLDVGIQASFTEKFANLIVKECIDKIDNEHKIVLGDINDEWDRGYLGGLAESSSIIKKTFQT